MTKGWVALALGTLLLCGCTGGKEGTAAVEKAPSREAPAPEAGAQGINARAELTQLSSAIPLYAGAVYRSDLTKRDEVMVRNQYGPGAEVLTLASDDSFPQVYHYYMTYLAQFRAFPAQNPYPAERRDWRTLEVHLNPAMQDPFIPGQTLATTGKQVILQIAETEAEPKTVIRYIVTPGPTMPMRTASAEPIVGAAR